MVAVDTRQVAETEGMVAVDTQVAGADCTVGLDILVVGTEGSLVEEDTGSFVDSEYSVNNLVAGDTSAAGGSLGFAGVDI